MKREDKDTNGETKLIPTARGSLGAVLVKARSTNSFTSRLPIGARSPCLKVYTTPPNKASDDNRMDRRTSARSQHERAHVSGLCRYLSVSI